MARTRLGTITGITETYQNLESLSETDEIFPNFKEVELENTGDADLRIAVTNPLDAWSKTLSVGKTMFLEDVNFTRTYVKTVDDSVDNILEFVANPEQ